MKHWFLGLMLLATIACRGETGHHTFTSPDGSFRFTYPDGYALFTSEEIERMQGSYLGVCDKSVAVCLGYPASSYEGTNFGDAAFQVNMITDADTENQCLNPTAQQSSEPNAQIYPAFRVPSKHRDRKINGVTFLHGIRGGAASNHVIETDLFRTFHNGKCYELATNISKTAYEVYPPGTIGEFTRKDEQHVRQELDKIVESFKFLK